LGAAALSLLALELLAAAFSGVFSSHAAKASTDRAIKTDFIGRSTLISRAGYAALLRTQTCHTRGRAQGDDPSSVAAGREARGVYPQIDITPRIDGRGDLGALQLLLPRSRRPHPNRAQRDAHRLTLPRTGVQVSARRQIHLNQARHGLDAGQVDGLALVRP